MVTFLWSYKTQSDLRLILRLCGQIKAQLLNKLCWTLGFKCKFGIFSLSAQFISSLLSETEQFWKVTLSFYLRGDTWLRKYVKNLDFSYDG